MLYQTVETIDMQKSRLFTRASEYNDPVWTDARHDGTPIGMHTETADEDFAYPDVKQHIFTTYESIPINAVMSNNFVFPVRVKPAMSYRRVADEMKKLNPNLLIEKGGVFIITEFKVGNKYGRESGYFDSLVSYYKDLFYADETYNWVSKNLSNHIQQVRNNTKVRHHSDFDRVDDVIKTVEYDSMRDCLSVRITSFVPIEVLRTKGPVYLREEGLVLYLGNIDKTVAHPASEAYINERVNSLPVNQKDFFSYEIVDNDSDNRYFMRFGNQVRELPVLKDIRRKNGLHYAHYKNTIRMETHKLPLERLKEWGIYTSEEEATTGGTEQYAKNLEFEKLKYAYEELKAKTEKLQTENQMAREEREFKLSNNKLTADINKHKFVFDSLLSQQKFDNDSKLARDKFNLESKLLTTKLSNEHQIATIKAQNETNLVMLKAEQDRQNAEHKAILDYCLSRQKLYHTQYGGRELGRGGDQLEGALDAMKTTSSILRDLS